MARPDITDEEKCFYRTKLNYPGKSQQLQPCSSILAPGVDDFEEQKERNGVIGGLKPKLHPNDKKPLHDRLFAHADKERMKRAKMIQEAKEQEEFAILMAQQKPHHEGVNQSQSHPNTTNSSTINNSSNNHSNHSIFKRLYGEGHKETIRREEIAAKSSVNRKEWTCSRCGLHQVWSIPKSLDPPYPPHPTHRTKKHHHHHAQQQQQQGSSMGRMGMDQHSVASSSSMDNTLSINSGRYVSMGISHLVSSP